MNIIEELFALQDLKYRSFNSKLIPTVDPELVIGVRTPALRKLANEYNKSEESKAYIHSLPHKYYEENNLHAFLIEKIKNFDECIAALNLFLPYVDNWATCDSMKPPVLAKNREKLLPQIWKWLESDSIYTVRYAINLLMSYFLDDCFSPVFPERVAAVVSEEYYINMMIAWYFATGFAKQYESFIPYLEKHILPPVVEKMTVRKACESFRITADQKEYIKSIHKSA